MMPKLEQILEQSSGTRQVCVSIFFSSDHCIKQNRFHVAVGLFSNSEAPTHGIWSSSFRLVVT